MVNASIAIRIYLSSWNKMRRIFKAEKGETICSYMSRLANELEGRNRE